VAGKYCRLLERQQSQLPLRTAFAAAAWRWNVILGLIRPTSVSEMFCTVACGLASQPQLLHILMDWPVDNNILYVLSCADSLLGLCHKAPAVYLLDHVFYAKCSLLTCM
jgi:hypothetical protein